ncbi:hypothetical protein SAMD00019534_037450 [Acytostelium subglobosum LB1]|uniref:hypothetical protein n=1 Tax=Acytostelium subglobosum LB1 TaxID=1410327 RepID=UPI000644D57F|nr:hypothetical protein SAMD00019534_037450 [Acytostelium subglobosum LB1]GAM20570.1 hypothetical protein SAMD00019534_037450 [Acytostelium subglobosum LB1]|eukprot:XP_012760091.1 hypothetical protein SAMD00019534_037450 [Acytostelium subglobosum LB1]
MFSRLITRSLTSSRRVALSNKATFKPMGSSVFYSTKKATTTAPPPPPPKSGRREDEAEELEKFDTEAEVPQSVLKELEKSRAAQKQQYQDIVAKLTETTEESKVSSKKFEVKPTIAITTASGKVAHALFSMASQARSLAIVGKDADLIIKAFEKIPSFRSTIEEPEVEVADKQNLIDFFIASIPLSPIGEFFLYYMANENNFKNILPALSDYKRLVASLSTEMTVRLTIAREYNAKEKEQLELQIRSYFTEDTQMSFIYTVDPSIKSGYKVESPLLNHNATLSAAIHKAEREENALFTEFFNELRHAAITDTAVWEKQEFKDKYFSFDSKAYEESIEKELKK